MNLQVFPADLTTYLNNLNNHQFYNPQHSQLLNHPLVYPFLHHNYQPPIKMNLFPLIYNLSYQILKLKKMERDHRLNFLIIKIMMKKIYRLIYKLF